MISFSMHRVAKDWAMARWIGQALLNEDFLTHPEVEVLSPWLSIVSSDVHRGP